MKPARHLPRFTRDIWLTLVTFVVVVIAFGSYVRAEKQLDRAHESRLQSFFLADELRQSSDDLTRMVRTYVVTSDPRYKQQTRKFSPSATASSRARSIIKTSTGIWCWPISNGRARKTGQL